MNAHDKAEILSTLNEVRGEISRLNNAHREVVFNPAITQMVATAQAILNRAEFKVPSLRMDGSGNWVA